MNVVFCDIDGTFQEMGGDIPQINFDSIDALQKQGDHFVFISGRGYDQLQDILSQLTNDCDVIFSNGAGYRLMGEEPVYRAWLSIEACKETVAVLEERNIFYFIHTDEGIIMKPFDSYRSNFTALKKKLEPLGEVGERIAAYKENFFINECRHVEDPIAYLMDNPDVKTLKIEMMEACDEEMEQLRELLSSEEAYVFSSFLQSLEVVNPISSKGHGIEHFMSNFPDGKSYGIGDGENDLAMLEVVDVPVAVANASDHVKSKAQVITGDCSAGGVGQFIFDYLIAE